MLGMQLSELDQNWDHAEDGNQTEMDRQHPEQLQSRATKTPL